MVLSYFDVFIVDVKGVEARNDRFSLLCLRHYYQPLVGAAASSLSPPCTLFRGPNAVITVNTFYDTLLPIPPPGQKNTFPLFGIRNPGTPSRVDMGKETWMYG